MRARPRPKASDSRSAPCSSRGLEPGPRAHFRRQRPARATHRRMHEPAIPVTIVTGFLGAGKSTLLQRWLGELPRDETVVIVNERGEVGIDGELLAARVARL